MTGPATVRVGEEFEVLLDATLPVPTKALSLVIRFDPKVLTFVDARPAELARGSGIEQAPHKLDPALGRLDVDLQARSKPLAGPGQLLRLRFAPKTARAQTTIALGQSDSGAGDARLLPKATTLRVRVNP